MTLPPGVSTSKPNQACKLVKSLYGLKQARRRCMLMMWFLAGNDLEEFTLIKKTLDNALNIKYLGKLEYFLGIEVAHSKEGIFIC